jgi:hypothetical protein
LDFLPEQEITDLLEELTVTRHMDGGACIYLKIDPSFAAITNCFCNDSNPCESDSETFCLDLTSEQMVETLVRVIRKIHDGNSLLVPVGKWRSVFDAVAFSMAENDVWQEFDASATIKLNTRDPLLFETGDEQILIDLITALMNDAETPEQGVFLIPAGAPMLVHIQPGGPVKLWFGNSVLADEVREAYAG